MSTTNPELSRRAANVKGSKAVIALDPEQRLAMADAITQAESFDALPKQYQAIILEAEQQLGIKEVRTIQFQYYDLDRAVTIRYDYKGSSKSGNYGHAGRPGKVGGSSPRGNVPSHDNLIDRADDVPFNRSGVRAYFILGDTAGDHKDRVLPVTGDFNEYDAHIGVMESGADDNAALFGFSKEEAKAVLDAYNNLKMAGPSYDEWWGKILATGAVRVGQYSQNIVIETHKQDTPTLRRLQSLYDSDKLVLLSKHSIHWGSADGERASFDLDTFLRSKTVKQLTYERFKAMKIRIRQKGSAKSGNYAHAGRPGKVGGSSPRRQLVMSLRDSVDTLAELSARNPSTKVELIFPSTGSRMEMNVSSLYQMATTNMDDGLDQYQVSFEKVPALASKLPIPKRKEPPIVQAKYTDPTLLPSYVKDMDVNDPQHGKLRADALLSAIYKDQGFDGKPDLVTKKQLDAYIQNGEMELFRGLSGQGKVYAEQFKTGEYFAGRGMSGDGTYTASSVGLAAGYATGSQGVIMRMSLRKGARVATQDDITSAQMAAEDVTGHSPYLFHDPGRVAAAMGFDAYMPYSGGIVIILNRTAVRVQIENVNRQDEGV